MVSWLNKRSYILLLLLSVTNWLSGNTADTPNVTTKNYTITNSSVASQTITNKGTMVVCVFSSPLPKTFSPFSNSDVEDLLKTSRIFNQIQDSSSNYNPKAGCIKILSKAQEFVERGFDQQDTLLKNLNVRKVLGFEAINKYALFSDTTRITIDYDYDFIELSKSKRLLVNKNGMYGFITRSGFEIIPPQFRNASIFANGFALVEDQTGLKYYIDENYINRETSYHLDIDQQVIFADSFSCNLARLKYSDIEKVAGMPTRVSYYNFLDKSGKLMFSSKEKLSDAENFQNDLCIAASSKTLKYGVLQINGFWKINPQYDTITHINENGTVCFGIRTRKDNFHRIKYGLLDLKSQNIVLDTISDEPIVFHEGFARIINNSTPLPCASDPLYSKGTYGNFTHRSISYINLSFKKVLGPYQSGTDFSNGYAVISKTSSKSCYPFIFNIINQFGNELFSNQYLGINIIGDTARCLLKGNLPVYFLLKKGQPLCLRNCCLLDSLIKSSLIDGFEGNGFSIALTGKDDNYNVYNTSFCNPVMHDVETIDFTSDSSFIILQKRNEFTKRFILSTQSLMKKKVKVITLPYVPLRYSTPDRLFAAKDNRCLRIFCSDGEKTIWNRGFKIISIINYDDTLVRRGFLVLRVRWHNLKFEHEAFYRITDDGLVLSFPHTYSKAYPFLKAKDGNYYALVKKFGRPYFIDDSGYRVDKYFVKYLELTSLFKDYLLKISWSI